MAEAFFATLECELIDRRTWRSPAEARMAVFSYIEGWYNPRRRHSALGYLSPAAFEARHTLALGAPACTLDPATFYFAACAAEALDSHALKEVQQTALITL